MMKIEQRSTGSIFFKIHFFFYDFTASVWCGNIIGTYLSMVLDSPSAFRRGQSTCPRGICTSDRDKISCN